MPLYNKVYIVAAYCAIYKYTYKHKKILRTCFILIPPPLVLPFLFLALLCVTSFSSMEISLGRGVLALFQRRGRYFSQKCHQRLFRLSSQDRVEKRLWEKLGSGSIVEVVGLYFSNHYHHLIITIFIINIIITFIIILGLSENLGSA